MEIRLLTITDYEQIYALWQSTPGMGLRSLDDTQEGISKFLKRNPETNFGAVIDGKIVGVIMVGNDGRRGYIYHTAVALEYRKKGIASALVQASIDALRRQGINKVALVVYKDNELGNAFWQAKGFELREDISYRNYVINIDNQ